MTAASNNLPTDSSRSTEGWVEEEEGAQLSPLFVDAVGRALQTHFQAIAEMPLPDNLMVLLAELEARERSS